MNDENGENIEYPYVRVTITENGPAIEHNHMNSMYMLGVAKQLENIGNMMMAKEIQATSQQGSGLVTATNIPQDFNRKRRRN